MQKGQNYEIIKDIFLFYDLILSKLCMDDNITKTQIFHNMKFERERDRERENK